MNSSRVLLVGGGLTSALTASMISQLAPHLDLVVWDKARGAGGRMSTSRAPSCPSCTVDMGAQYISPSPSSLAQHGDLFRGLERDGVLEPLQGGVEGARPDQECSKHYVAPEGTSSIVKHFFSQAGVEVQFNRRVTGLTQVEEGGWLVTTECGEEEKFQEVLLTIPVPQVLQLGGGLPEVLSAQPGLLSNLRGVQYSARFVLAMFYNRQVNLGVPWVASYIKNNDMVRFVSVDNLKRGRPDLPTSVLVHGTVQHGLANKAASPAMMKEPLLTAVLDLFPSWPSPSEVKPLKWLYSQVHKPYPGTPGSLTLARGLRLGGDGISQTSNFDGCVQSAAALVSSLLRKEE